MTDVVVDAATRAKLLSSAGELVVVRDEAGQVIGKFVPGANSIVRFVPEDDVTDEELDRRVREDKRFTPEEVMARLRSLRDAS